MPDPRTMDYTICDIINSTLSRGDLETLSAVPNEVSGGTSSCNVGHSRSRGSDGSLENEGKGCGQIQCYFWWQSLSRAWRCRQTSILLTWSWSFTKHRTLNWLDLGSGLVSVYHGFLFHCWSHDCIQVLLPVKPNFSFAYLWTHVIQYHQFASSSSVCILWLWQHHRNLHGVA